MLFLRNSRTCICHSPGINSFLQQSSRQYFLTVSSSLPVLANLFRIQDKQSVHSFRTDLPSIVSGTRIGVFDPHKAYFKTEDGECTTGHQWRFEEDSAAASATKIPDQFAPYEGIFGCQTRSLGTGYNGTLFRFPLRDCESKLSKNLYSAERLRERFESFEMDAHMPLLFLNNLETIEFYLREEHMSSPTKTFEVRIEEGSLEQVRAKRREFVEQIQHLERGEVPETSVSVTYPVTIKCTRYGQQERSESRRFWITNFIGGEELVSDAQALIEAEDLSYLPRVGVAVPLDQTCGSKDPQGHLFCFLPLPVEKKSLTGLPVHVNGFFALEQNRRHLKWPTPDQEEGGKELTDESLKWNKFLVEKVVPQAYADLLLKSKTELPLDVFYGAWPDPTKTDPKWQEMLAALYNELLSHATFYTTANGGGWITIHEAIFNTLDVDCEAREIVEDALQAANESIVSVPRHVIEMVEEYYYVSTVTPEMVRQTLRHVPHCYQNLDRDDKLLLLEYVLKDLETCFDDLSDLELLPVSSGSFARFLPKDQRSGETFYISSRDHNKSLLPGLDHLFVDGSITGSILETLKSAARRGTCYCNELIDNYSHGNC